MQRIGDTRRSSHAVTMSGSRRSKAGPVGGFNVIRVSRTKSKQGTLEDSAKSEKSDSAKSETKKGTAMESDSDV